MEIYMTRNATTRNGLVPLWGQLIQYTWYTDIILNVKGLRLWQEEVHRADIIQMERWTGLPDVISTSVTRRIGNLSKTRSLLDSYIWKFTVSMQTHMNCMWHVATYIRLQNRIETTIFWAAVIMRATHNSLRNQTNHNPLSNAKQKNGNNAIQRNISKYIKIEWVFVNILKQILVNSLGI